MNGATGLEHARRLSVGVSEAVDGILKTAMDIQADISANRVTVEEIAGRYAELALNLRDTWVAVAGISSMEELAKGQE